jgi:minor histocompatibility antigen H13
VYDVFWVFGSPAITGGDNVMLTVATSEVIDAPTRLLYPRAAGASSGEAGNFPYSLLGLGDVAVPGLLAGLTLRYDASRVTDMRTRAAATFEAIEGALRKLPRDSDRRTMGDTAATAALRAYDDIADKEDARRDATTSDSESEWGGPQARGALVSDAVMQQRRYFVPVMIAYVLGLGLAFGANAMSGKGQPALMYLCPLTLGSVLLTALLRNELGRIWAFVDLPSSVPKLRDRSSNGD